MNLIPVFSHEVTQFSIVSNLVLLMAIIVIKIIINDINGIIDNIKKFCHKQHSALVNIKFRENPNVGVTR